MRRRQQLWAVCAVLCLGFAWGGPARAQWAGLDASYEPTWAKIKRIKKITLACISDPPYASLDPTTNKWTGFHIRIIDAIAKDLGVEWECKSSNWSTAALDIQSGKVDLMMSAQATPERAQLITFVGPMYSQGFAMLNRKGFKPGERWDDYNKPDVRLAAITGSANELVMDLITPKATKIALAQGGQPAMAVGSGRADAFLASSITGPVAVMRNPSLGDLVVPEPLFAWPAYMGVREEPDRRFANFLHWWIDWNKGVKSFNRWLREALVETGIEEGKVPPRMIE